MERDLSNSYSEKLEFSLLNNAIGRLVFVGMAVAIVEFFQQFSTLLVAGPVPAGVANIFSDLPHREILRYLR